MPLPDASKKSPRVYTLLQNTDLDNVTFDTVQAVGNPIAIEEANEDEMRRQVLVNLCRLVTSGEWNGLLTAGSTPTFNPTMLQSAGADEGFTQYSILTSAPMTGYATSTGGSAADIPYYFQFVSSQTGTVASLSIDVQTAFSGTEWDIGVYSINSAGAPDELMAEATFDMSSTGLVTQGTLSDTLSLTQGSSYWIGFTRSATGGGVAKAWGSNNAIGVIGIDRNNVNSVSNILYSLDSQTLPATLAADDMKSAQSAVLPLIGVIWD